MPACRYEAIPLLVNKVERLKPKTVLDIGTGFGKYGMLLREVLEFPFQRFHKHQWETKIDGVEAFTGYKNPIHDHVYNKVYYGDILDVVHEMPKYDVILLI
ncbi:MAG: glycosyltransferase family 1 protein, partial [Bacillota bacterium]|nr:glycosyltransferase family 1 protein [Bacillota bacterium]